MRVHYVTQNLFTDMTYGHSGYPTGKYFRSHTDARKWANSLVKEFVQMNREWDKSFRLADIGWGAEITIQACDFVSTDKAMLLRLLNTEGGYFGPQKTVERWTTTDKWKAPVEVSDADADDSDLRG